MASYDPSAIIEWFKEKLSNEKRWESTVNPQWKIRQDNYELNVSQ